MTTALVLAGGRSRRFGGQKLAAETGGQPILRHAIAAVSEVCDEVLVVGPPEGLPEGLVEAGAEIVLDTQAHEGPLVALVGAAHVATGERLLLVGGDMPALQSSVLRRLLAFEEPHRGACLFAEGRRQPFPSALRRAELLDRGAALVAQGRRSLWQLVGDPGVEVVSEDEWRALDPSGLSLRDVDRPQDLPFDDPLASGS